MSTITRALGQLEQQGLIERLPLHRIVVREERDMALRNIAGLTL